MHLKFRNTDWLVKIMVELRPPFCHIAICSLQPFLAFLSAEFAMSPNNNEVHIYSKKGTKWEVEHVLKEV